MGRRIRELELHRMKELVHAECKRLAKLGANGIAHEFQSRSIGGNHLVDACPLANGLCDTLMMQPRALAVWHYVISWHGETVCEMRNDFPPVAEFVSNFDQGNYPYLEV